MDLGGTSDPYVKVCARYYPRLVILTISIQGLSSSRQEQKV